MADIEEVHGQLLFNTEADWLVNTVNCVGVMGAGIALECKYRYPGLFEAYEEQCKAGRFKPGMLWPYRRSKPKILCIATKADWHHPSKVEYVENGLKKLAANYKEIGIRSIAMPHLGCSHGGLSWNDDVRPLVFEYLGPGKKGQGDLKVQVHSFDPMAQDNLYDQLEGKLRDLRRRLSVSDIKDEIGFGTQGPCNRLFEAIDSGEVNNMFSLQRAPGVGDKTIEKIYEFLTQGPERGRYTDSFVKFPDEGPSTGSTD